MFSSWKRDGGLEKVAVVALDYSLSQDSALIATETMIDEVSR